MQSHKIQICRTDAHLRLQLSDFRIGCRSIEICFPPHPEVPELGPQRGEAAALVADAADEDAFPFGLYGRSLYYGAMQYAMVCKPPAEGIYSMRAKRFKEARDEK